MRTGRLFLLALFLAAALVAAGCADEDDDESGIIPYVVRVIPQGPSRFDASLSGAEAGAGWSMNYPGVSAYRVNHMLSLESPSASLGGDMVSMTIRNVSKHSIGRLWVRVSTDHRASLSSQPQVVNGRGESIFVLGSLGVGDSMPVLLEFAAHGAGGYTVYLDFMEVHERIAYYSNHLVPDDAGEREIYTMNPNGTDIYRVTSYSPKRDVAPNWSPGGEWIAFERNDEYICGTTLKYRAQIYLVHPDGSNLHRVSQNVYACYTPTWGPTGDLLAYSCRANCVDWDTDIYLYNLRTGEQKVIIEGTGYIDKSVVLPDWSPDGKWMAVRVVPVVNHRQIAYVAMDPWTGEPQSPITPFLEINNPQTRNNNRYVMTSFDTWRWAPDSRHGLVMDLVYSVLFDMKTPWHTFRGVGIFDFQQALDSNILPMVPDMIPVLDENDPPDAPPWGPAQFSQSGDRIWFQSYNYQFNVSLQYMELYDYVPLTGERITVLDDDFDNNMPAPFRTMLKTFYMSLP